MMNNFYACVCEYNIVYKSLACRAISSFGFVTFERQLSLKLQFWSCLSFKIRLFSVNLRKMQFIFNSLVSIFFAGFVTSFTIISTGYDYEDLADLSDENDISMIVVNPYNQRENVLETMYTSESFGKGHRFYFTAGERKDGK